MLGCFQKCSGIANSISCLSSKCLRRGSGIWALARPFGFLSTFLVYLFLFWKMVTVHSFVQERLRRESDKSVPKSRVDKEGPKTLSITSIPEMHPARFARVPHSTSQHLSRVSLVSSKSVLQACVARGSPWQVSFSPKVSKSGSFPLLKFLWTVSSENALKERLQRVSRKNVLVPQVSCNVSFASVLPEGPRRLFCSVSVLRESLPEVFSKSLKSVC